MANEITFDALLNNLKSESDEARKFFDVTESISALIGDLVAARIRKGWTQRELAAACGIKQSAIARMERFQVMPRLDTVVKIARELDIRIAAEKIAVEESVSVTECVPITINNDTEHVERHSNGGFNYSNNIVYPNFGTFAAYQGGIA